MNYFSLSNLKQHTSAEDCWIAIHGKVYDVTKFLAEHPGGEDILLENAGTDATIEFDKVGHSDDAKELMKNYEIGILKKDRCCMNDKFWKSFLITSAIVLLISFGSFKLLRRQFD